jgi:hypothetical protein
VRILDVWLLHNWEFSVLTPGVKLHEIKFCVNTYTSLDPSVNTACPTSKYLLLMSNLPCSNGKKKSKDIPVTGCGGP